MNRIALSSSVAAATVALSVMTAPVVLAQEQTPSCDEAKRVVVELETRVTNAAADENVRERAELDAAKAALEAAQREVVRLTGRLADEQGKPEQDQDPDEINRLIGLLDRAEDTVVARQTDVEAAEDALKVDGDELAGLRARLALALADRDDKCGTPTTTPTTPPATTTPPAANDVDCGDVSDDEAQRILDEDPADPNRLDEDGDGIACEDEVVLNPPADNGAVVVPSGGVATGAGPA